MGWQHGNFGGFPQKQRVRTSFRRLWFGGLVVFDFVWTDVFLGTSRERGTQVPHLLPQWTKFCVFQTHADQLVRLACSRIEGWSGRLFQQLQAQSIILLS